MGRGARKPERKRFIDTDRSHVTASTRAVRHGGGSGDEDFARVILSPRAHVVGRVSMNAA